jgi:hypothetical protein
VREQAEEGCGREGEVRGLRKAAGWWTMPTLRGRATAAVAIVRTEVGRRASALRLATSGHSIGIVVDIASCLAAVLATRTRGEVGSKIRLGLPHHMTSLGVHRIMVDRAWNLALSRVCPKV